MSRVTTSDTRLHLFDSCGVVGTASIKILRYLLEFCYFFKNSWSSVYTHTHTHNKNSHCKFQKAVLRSGNTSSAGPPVLQRALSLLAVTNIVESIQTLQ